MKTLLIVESPAKSKTIEKLLGKDYIVLSSFGHIRNLDKKSLGIDVKNNFAPNYRILSERSKQIKAIQEAIKNVDNVLLASDEDREGEAIAWHCAIVFKLKINEKNRICFHEITKNALENAIANPRTIDMSMVYSQQARRILDRLMGFQLSPLLWKYICPKLSAGRVQSVALKVIVDQEMEIANFVQQKNYKTICTFDKNLCATLNYVFPNENEINDFLKQCSNSNTSFKIINIQKTRNERRPPPPYITSTIQQDASLRFGIGAKKIMNVLQKLYENGCITYHRTDSTNLSEFAKEEIKKYVTHTFGKDYVHLRIYKSKIKCAQEAHEAIRPTNIDKIELNEDIFDEIDKKIYSSIWKRTIASQMSAYVYDFYIINIGISFCNDKIFIAKGEKMIFDGYKKIYDEHVDNEDDDIVNHNVIHENLKNDELLTYHKITICEKYEKGIARMTEASLIKKMEKIGIGRPSTYSNIIETIMERKYVEKKDIKGQKMNIMSYILENGKNIQSKEEHVFIGAEKKKLIPTNVGTQVITFLKNNFDEIIDYQFTSLLENQLDDIANNKVIWNDVVSFFYEKFHDNVQKLNDNKDDRKRIIGKNNDGETIYAYVAKYGPVIQIGDGKNCTYVKLDPKYDVNTITMEQYLEMEQFPKILGKYEEFDVLLKKGPYGYYISHNDKNYKLLDDTNINLENAIQCITTKTENNNNICIIDNKYQIKNGNYGYYILFRKKFYNIPKDYDISKLTKEDCDKIVKIPKKETYKK